MKDEKKYNHRYFSFLLVLLSVCLGVFFSKIVTCEYDMIMHHAFAKVVFSDEMYQADVPLQALSYPLYHISIRVISLLLKIEIEPVAAVLLTLSIIASIVLYRKMMLLIMRDTVSNRYMVDVVSIGAVLFVTARSWLNDWRYYALQCAANPIHNPTTIFVRPFGIAGLYLFLLYIKKYQEKTENKKLLLGCSILLLLSTIVKPSFVFVFLPAMGIMVLLLMLQTKDVLLGLKALLAAAPTLILLMMQQMFVSNHTGMLNINVHFGSFSNFNLTEVLCVSIVTFPVPVLLFCMKSFKHNFAYCLSMVALLIGWLQMFCLTNGSSGDFSWGYDISVQVATVISIANAGNDKKKRFIRCLAYLVFAYQVLSGIMYMLLVYQTGEFWF